MQNYFYRNQPEKLYSIIQIHSSTDLRERKQKYLTQSHFYFNINNKQEPYEILLRDEIEHVTQIQKQTHHDLFIWLPIPPF